MQPYSVPETVVVTVIVFVVVAGAGDCAGVTIIEDTVGDTADDAAEGDAAESDAADDELGIGTAAEDAAELGVTVTKITDSEELGADEAADETAGALDGAGAATEDEALWPSVTKRPPITFPFELGLPTPFFK
jgi:hypothetical protein